MTNLRDIRDFKDLVNVPNLNEQVIDDFRANEGRVGGPYEGAPIILVLHVGAQTGTKRVSPKHPTRNDCDGTGATHQVPWSPCVSSERRGTATG